MDFLFFVSSEGFFQCSEPLAQPEVMEFRSIRGRRLVLARFAQTLLAIPLILLYKLYKTALSFLGVAWGLVALVATFCNSLASREFFFKKVAKLAKDLADWVLWPIGAALCLCRLLLAASVHPALYFRI